MSLDRQGNFPGFNDARQAMIAAHAAATATEIHTVAVATKVGRLVSVKFYPDAAITGQATNYTNLNTLLNATEKGNVDFLSGTNGATTGVTLYAPATPIAVAVGDLVRVQHEKVASGLDIPSGLVVTIFDYEPTA